MKIVPTCEYFALCANPADGAVELPFGWVPTCQRCADKMGQVLVPAEWTTEEV